MAPCRSSGVTLFNLHVSNGPLQTWIMLDELCGAIECNYLINYDNETSPDSSISMGPTIRWLNLPLLTELFI